MYSISKLCREFNLSRSTLLYYDTIGLLTASERTRVNYRRVFLHKRIPHASMKRGQVLPLIVAKNR